jgi:hypothetical protein
MTLPPTGPGPGQPWPQQWPPNPAPQRRPAWMLPIAIIVAAVLITGGAITVALINKSGTAGPNATAPSVSPSTSAQLAGSSENTATCKAWRTTSAALEAIPALPDGWDWTTPNIDTLISNAKTAVDKALDIFESKIAPNDPPQVVSAAKGYIAAKRTDMTKAADHTITEADDTAVDVSRGTLNQLCTL